MDWHVTSETFWLPIFLRTPREPTLAEPHDRQPIKEYNDLPAVPLFLSLSLRALWLILQTNLFIVCRCLSAEVAGGIDPFCSPFDWLRFDFESGQELFIACLPALGEEEHNGGLHSLFISTRSQSFCTSSRLDLSQRREVWPPTESEAHSVDSQRIHRGQFALQDDTRTDCVWMKWYFTGPGRESLPEKKKNIKWKIYWDFFFFFSQFSTNGKEKNSF